MAGEPDVYQALSGIPAGAPAIVMAHNPLHFNEILRPGCVVLSGHTHGGQISFPGRGASMLPTFGYISGWYQKGPNRLYVNRGIGTVILPIRIAAPPEISVFDVVV